MVKREVRIMVRGAQRAGITVEAMVAIIIALGRELDGRQQADQVTAEAVARS